MHTRTEGDASRCAGEKHEVGCHARQQPPQKWRRSHGLPARGPVGAEPEGLAVGAQVAGGGGVAGEEGAEGGGLGGGEEADARGGPDVGGEFHAEGGWRAGPEGAEGGGAEEAEEEPG